MYRVARMMDWIDRYAYKFQHYLFASVCLPITEVYSKLAQKGAPLPSLKSLKKLKEELKLLLEMDLENVQNSRYPKELLFQIPYRSYLKSLPLLMAESSKMANRRIRRDTKVEPPVGDPSLYPKYYLNAFHWQPQGWLSAESASLWDLQLELYFSGTGDILRRLVIPSIIDATQGVSTPQVLDIGCSTGRLLLQLHRALPQAQLTGVDLSPYYIKRAQETLKNTNVRLEVSNAESLTFSDQSFDVVILWGVLHEIPQAVRRVILREAHRVLRSDGTLLISDARQLTHPEDEEGFGYFFLRHAKVNHEPYFENFLRDPVERLYQECGFEYRGKKSAFFMDFHIGIRGTLTRQTDPGHSN